MPPVCSIRHLTVRFPTRRSGTIRAVDDLSLDIRPGEALGIVGESGSGKSMMAMSLLGLVPPPGVASGRVLVAGKDVFEASPRELTELRRKKLGLVMQDPTPSLNPVRSIGSQLAEAARVSGVERGAARGEIRSALQVVGLEPDFVLKKRPFELSGGMNQRVVIAMALIQRPEILVADEPTTALDVTTQVGILKLLDRLRRERGMALILISHDIGVIYQLVDRVAVMYAGKLVELGGTERVVHSPAHPYTRALLAALPEIGSRGADRLTTIPGQLKPVRDGDSGCPYRERCEYAMNVCGELFPSTIEVAEGHETWCWWVEREADLRSQESLERKNAD